MLRPGYLQRAWRLLEILATYQPNDLELEQLSTTDGVDTRALLDLLRQAGYLASDPIRITLSVNGSSALALGAGQAFMSQFIEDYIRVCKPNWAGVVRQGRASFESYASGELHQCFDEAGLLQSNLDAAVWWDMRFLEHHSDGQVERMRVGRLGESKSVHFEMERIGIEPEWVSLRRPKSPYDILSYTSRGSAERQIIEVKASQLPLNEARLFLSSAEWRVLESARNASVHLWPEVEGSATRPVVIPVAAVREHIPDDIGQGRWELVTIPFDAFDEH